MPGNAKPLKVGYLILKTKSKKKDNIGGDIIRRILMRGGFDVVNCQPCDINKFHLVIYSIPSTFQIIDFLAAARKFKFDKRKCSILIGGFGCQNINSIYQYVDFAYYGRAHLDIIDVVGSILKNGGSDNKSLFSTKYPSKVKLNYNAGLFCDGSFQESFIGCENTCSFCHYTHARGRKGQNSKTYNQGLLTNGLHPEILFKDIKFLKKKPGRVRTAIDGFSQRLRYKYGKKISNIEIIESINHLGGLVKSTTRKQFNIFGGVDVVGRRECVVVLAYNIGHFPTETEDDISELNDTLRQCTPKGRVIVILQTTPFRPSLLTPMQWSPVKIFPQWLDRQQQTIVDNDKFLFKYSYTLEGALTHLMSVIIDRYGVYGDDQEVIDFLIKNRRGRNQETAMDLMANGGGKYTYALDINKHDPLPYVDSYYNKKRLQRLALALQ